MTVSAMTVLKTKTRYEEILTDVEKNNNPSIQVSAKLTLTEKGALYSLIKAKGCDGLTGFLKMLSKAREVEIRL